MLLALSANAQVNAKVASGGINLSSPVHQGLEVANALNALGINEVSTMFASDSPLAAKGAFSKVAPATPKQLQKKFKHAGDFGVEGNFNKANAAKFNQAIQKHINAPGTKQIQGSYRGNSVTFQTNPSTNLTVIQNPNGSFLSGWKFSGDQMKAVLGGGNVH